MKHRGVAAIVALLAALGLTLSAAPASAHGGEPVITVEEAHSLPAGVHYIVRMTYANDGDTISGKVVTATPVGPDGVAGATVTLTPGDDGIYQGPVDMPVAGTWTVTFASADPVGSLSHTEVRTEPTTVPTTAAPPAPSTDAPSTQASTTTTAAADQSDDDQATPAASTDDDDDGMSPLIFIGALVVALGGAVAAWLTIKRRGTGATPPPPPAET